MKLETGWVTKSEYCVVKPLRNGRRQELIMLATHIGGGHWYIAAGIFSCNISYATMNCSEVWKTPTSANKNPSFKTIPIALEALMEIENELIKNANGKRHYIYIDGMDERRLRVYTKVLTRYNCGYKKSTRVSPYCSLPMLYKAI